ncbi:signal peptidase I [Candidatus Palibaumannia cicadellinicola]|nr:signal peptidase I [Candidatus Baumannia cicadellinicola]
MAYIFALILAIATLITGITWFIKHLKRVLEYRKNSNGIGVKCKKYQDGWINIGASLFPVLLLVFVIRSFVFEPFQIPSGSMMPTLWVGDFILVNKFAYGIKNPITQSTMIKMGHPKRGDVVVFKYPPDPSLDYIKRVIGLPGDRVCYDPIVKRITIQPGWANHDHTRTSTLSITYSNIISSDILHNLNSNSNEYTSKSEQFLQTNQILYSGTRLSQYQESLDGVVHDILITPNQLDLLSLYYQQPGYALTEWIVPQGEYFMMGDNRDNSADSRYWGFVPEKNIVGKAIVIWMSFDKLEGKWPTGVRLSHIGSIH